MIKIIMIDKVDDRYIYSFETSNISDKGTVSLNPETMEMQLINVPESLEFISSKAYSALRYMIKNVGVAEEYVHAWY